MSTKTLVLNGPKRTLFQKIVLHFQKHWRLHVLALPAFLSLLAFAYAPMFGVVLAFQKYSIQGGFFGSEWIGFKNFEFLFQTADAWRITRNTILYNVAFILVNTSLSVILAMLFNELYIRKLAKTLQTMIILPNFLSMAVVAIIAYAFLKGGNSGILNQVVKAFGGKMRDWYMYKPVWPFLLVFINAWRGVGYGSIVYVASISGISQEYYEAAVLDGASKFQQALYVTLPHLRKIITIMLIMSVGSLLKGDFGLFYNVTQNNGALYEVTDVIDTYIYRALKMLGDTGMSSAAGLYQSAVGLVLVLLANWVVTKIDEESSMF